MTTEQDRSAGELLIIGGGLLQVPNVEEARKLGLRTIVTDLNTDCACASLADDFHAIDIFDVGRHVELVLELQRRGRPLRGVFAAGIDATLTAAMAADVARLPGASPRAAYVTHQKHIAREELATAGVPVPRFAAVASLAEATKAASRIGYPLIVKNIDGSASRGTMKLFERDDRALGEAVEAARQASSNGMALMEQLMFGSEHTVETLFDVNGRFWPCFITDRLFDTSGPWALETGLEHPTRVAPPVQEEMYAMMRRAADVVGIDVGPAKGDLMLTSEGPRIIEMTTRLSGGFDCQYLVPAATGKNVIRAAITTAIGQPLDPADLQPKLDRFAASASPWPEPGTIEAIEGLAEARAIPGVQHVFMRAQVGDVVKPYKDCAARVAFIIATGSSREAANGAARAAAERIQFHTSRAAVGAAI
jgi:biotin carboxylase